MATHPTRYYGGGDLHFITAGCYHRQPFLGTAPSPGRALQLPALWPAPRRIWQARFYDFNVSLSQSSLGQF